MLTRAKRPGTSPPPARSPLARRRTLKVDHGRRKRAVSAARMAWPRRERGGREAGRPRYLLRIRVVTEESKCPQLGWPIPTTRRTPNTKSSTALHYWEPSPLIKPWHRQATWPAVPYSRNWETFILQSATH